MQLWTGNCNTLRISYDFKYKNQFLLRHLLIFLLAISLFSCKKDTPAPPKSLPEATYQNVSYGGDNRQVMDIYLPANRSSAKTKTVVVIHGGAWTQGDKNEMKFALDSLRSHRPDFAYINVNYRLAYNNTVNVFPAQEDDIKSAVKFYLSKAGEYNVSKDLIMMGGSAGAHLAMLHSYKNDPDHHVKAVVDFFGPTDLSFSWHYDGIIAQLLYLAAIGKTYDQNPQIYIQSSPVNFITAQSPPTIALQGGADPLVNPSQTNLLIKKLEEKGVVHEKVFYPNESHGFTPATYTDAFEKIDEFLKEYVPE